MENYIDVAYKEVDKGELQDKSVEELTGEVNSLYDQMEFIGRIGMAFAANAGQRLIEIKSRLEHGEWEDWCRENLKFSIRKANRMMKLAEKADDENSLFFKNDKLSGIGISKVWELLAAPEEVAEMVAESEDIKNMSVLELQNEIKILKSALSENDTLLEEKKTLESQIDELKTKVEEANANDADKTELEELKTELEKTKDALTLSKNTLKDKVKAEKEKLEKAKQKELDEAVENAKVEALKEASTQTDKMRDRVLDLEEENEKLSKLLENSSSEAATGLKINAEIIQVTFNKCLDDIDEVKESDPDKAKKLVKYLKTIVQTMDGQLEG